MEWLIERFQISPDRIAFIHDGSEVSYGSVSTKIDNFLKYIQVAGIQRGETVVVRGDYSPELFCMIMALCCNGTIVVPLTHSSVVEESVALAVSGCDWYIEFGPNARDGEITHREMESDNALLNEFRRRGTPGLVLFSSGSTGNPKGMLHDFNQVAEKFRKQSDPTVAIPFLMMDHFGGINTLLAITSSLGTVVTVAERSVPCICAAIERYGVDLLPATPSFLNLMMASNLYKKFNLSSLKRITYGTEVMPQSTLDRLNNAFPQVLLQQTYGLSEVGVLRSQSRGDGSLWFRIGGEGFQTKIVNDVLWIKSKYAMVGYLNAPSEFDAEGWFNTQDKVEVDGDYLRVLGRVTDLINVAGQKVYPAEVEDVILELDNIRDVAIYGEKHNMLGNIIVAKVVLNTPESLLSLRTRIRKACFKKMSPYKVPMKVVLTDGTLFTSRHKKIRK